jgi:hypothetical protein
LELQRDRELLARHAGCSIMGEVRALALVIPVLLASAATAAAPGVRIYPSATDANTTEGDTIVDGDPASIYAVVVDYPKWTEVFPDVAKVIVTSRHGVDARVTLVKPDGNRDNLKFHNTPQARMLYFEDTGNAHATVWGEIVCAPGDQPGTTRVHTRLHADVHGIATLVVSADDVRKQREQRVERDLVHIRDYFRRISSR